MVDTKKSPVFPQQATMRDFPGFLGGIPPGEADTTDNPDGVVHAYGLGAYERGNANNRGFSQGAGTDKGNVGNASGTGKATRVVTGRGTR